MNRRRKKTDLTPVLNMPLARLAQRTAARIGFTVRRWWRDEEQTVLHVEVERRLVGAPPAVAELRVPLPRLSASQPRVQKRTATATHKRPGSRPKRAGARERKAGRVR